MKISIYTMTHKPFTPPADPIYRPLQVGCSNHAPLGYLRDDLGDNISAKNCYYSELTGLYWVYRNDTESDIIGTCHYRRYLMDEAGHLMGEAAILDYLCGSTNVPQGRGVGDTSPFRRLITTRQVHLNNSYRFGFSANHNLAALDTTGEVIRDLYPDYYDTYIRLVNGPNTYFGNMFITTRNLYMSYCEWLFTIFAEVEKRINLDTDEDAYHKRVLGFISEFLLLVWITVNNIEVMECKVAMLGEKAETHELKMKLADCFVRRDEQEAKIILLEALSKRPDLLMEASDITGELRMSMELIAIVEEEREKEKICLLDKETDFNSLMHIISELNSAVLEAQNDARNDARNESIRQKLSKTILNNTVSDSAIRIAETILA